MVWHVWQLVAYLRAKTGIAPAGKAAAVTTMASVRDIRRIRRSSRAAPPPRKEREHEICHRGIDHFLRRYRAESRRSAPSSDPQKLRGPAIWQRGESAHRQTTFKRS